MRRTNAGFTLIETLVAMAIFAIASLATTKLMVGSIRASAGNAQASEAVALAQDMLEEIRARPFANMQDEDVTVVSSRGGTVYTVSSTVTFVAANNVNRVNVRVSWNQQGETKTYEAESIFAQVASNL